MPTNKKIKNASVTIENNIKFKSILEKTIYNTLLQYGFEPKYEPITFTLWEGFTPITPFYDRESDSQRAKRDLHSSKILVPKMDKIIGIRYTPDFYIKYKNVDVWIEAKGMENDVFYIKKKLFRKYLDNILLKDNIKSLFFEIYTKKQLLQAINIIKEYGNSINKD